MLCGEAAGGCRWPSVGRTWPGHPSKPSQPGFSRPEPSQRAENTAVIFRGNSLLYLTLGGPHERRPLSTQRTHRRTLRPDQTRVATRETEETLLEYARVGSAAKLEQIVRGWKHLSRDGELTAEEARHQSRAFSVVIDGDGMYVMRGRLEPEVGAVLMRAIEAAGDALYRDENPDARPRSRQRRADAAGLVAERSTTSRTPEPTHVKELPRFSPPPERRSPRRSPASGGSWPDRSCSALHWMIPPSRSMSDLANGADPVSSHARA